MERSEVIVLHSGGLDSTVLLAALQSRGNKAVSLGVNYGQRHVREIEAARASCGALGVERVELNIAAGLAAALRGSALTSRDVALPEGHYEDDSMKATVVPNRNMLLLAIAGALAVSRKAGAVAYAAHAGDHAIYPDCRPEFVEVMGQALELCDWLPIKLLAPFAEDHVDKAGIVRLGAELGVDFSLTWSCYAGEAVHCGRCGTCVERREAFAVAGVHDPTVYEGTLENSF